MKNLQIQETMNAMGVQTHSDYRSLITGILLTVTLIALSSESADSALLHTLNPFKAIEVPIAKEGLTRITVSDDRIRNVFGMAGEYVLEADEDQGQIFIRSVDSASQVFGTNEVLKPAPIHLTITTEKGHTQDLHLLPRDQEPEALILQVETQDNKTSDIVLRHSSSVPPVLRDSITRDEVETLLRACEENRIPLGYKSVSLTLPTLKGPYLLVRELKGEKLRGLTYELRNHSEQVLHLSESTFSQSISGSLPVIIAILMPHKTLKPKETAYVYVVTPAL